MPDQLAAKPGDIFPVRLRRRLEGEIAFGVRAHRAVVEVGRTDAQDAIVDDHHLAVHHDRRGLVHPASTDRKDRSMTSAATNWAMNPPRPLCMACDEQDECIFGVTISTKLWHVQHPLRQQARCRWRW